MKWTNDLIIKELTKIFGDKYDYSKLNYTGCYDKVCVTCKIHGDFYSKLNDLLHGHGCPSCAGVKKLTRDEFIQKAKEKHGNEYDYSLVDYKNNSTPVKIICHKKDEFGNEHGIFEQTPRNHLNGDRCPKCFRSFKKTTEEFIKQAKKVHGDKYDYSKVIYNGNKKYITIICPKHGEFKQTPLYHLQGHGCLGCYNDRRGEKTRVGKEMFIKRAKEVHGDRYDYSKVNYINSKTPVIITCKKHGDFEQRPDKHIIRKQGCPICSESHMEKELSLFFDKNNIKYEREKRFDWLKSNAKLPLDFYLPEYNVAIECQGDQHYRPFASFGGEQALGLIKERDILKHDLCISNGVNIYYLTHSMSILQSSNIYTTENTFTSIEKLIQKIKNTTLFEQIVNEININ